MEPLQKRLVVCGVGLILAGLVYGHAYSFISNHTALLTIKDDYQAIFVDVTRSVNTNAGGSFASNDIDDINSKSTQHRRAVGAHAHAINLGLLITIIGLILSFALAGNKHACKIGYGLLTGSICYPTGLALQAMGLVLAGEAFALLGAALVLGCLAITLFFLLIKPQLSAE
ncbi:MAG: hypothetical protein HN764_07840 [Gammaproteobacteria bacterium]|jgi:hypothetical protein|nr:hypothetical protein [Gammaproteobacteria bacterium]